MKFYRILASIIVVTILSVGSYQSVFAQGMSGGVSPVIDCDKNGSINTALAAGHRVIEFTGVCEEDVFAEGFNQLDIRGSGASRGDNVIVGEINIIGPTSLQLANFEVSGSDGIFLSLAVAGTATDIAVDGVLGVLYGSNMFLRGIEVAGSVIITHNSWGLLRRNDGTGSSIVGGPDDQSLQILQHSSAVIQGGTIIENNLGGGALVVANGSRGLMNGGSISGGVAVNRASSFEVRNGTVDDGAGASPTAMAVGSHSLLTVRPNGTYVGDVDVSGDSAMMNEITTAAVMIAGTITCGDAESSLSGLITASAVSASCTGF